MLSPVEDKCAVLGAAPATVSSDEIARAAEAASGHEALTVLNGEQSQSRPRGAARALLAATLASLLAVSVGCGGSEAEGNGDGDSGDGDSGDGDSGDGDSGDGDGDSGDGDSGDGDSGDGDGDSGDGDGDSGDGDGPNEDVEVGQSSCAKPSIGGSSDTLANFDDDDDAPSVKAEDGRTGSWFTYPEAITLGLGSDGADGTSKALTVKASKEAGEDAGFGFTLNARGARSCPHNATAFKGIRFWIRSDDLTKLNVSAAQSWTTPLAEGGTCLEDCYNHHTAEISVSDEWKEVELEWSDFKPAGWGQELDFDARQLTQFVWVLPSDQALTVEVDQISLIEGGDLDDSLPPGFDDETDDTPPDGASPSCKPNSNVIDDLEGPDYSAYLWYTMGETNSGATVSKPLVVKADSGHAVRAKGENYKNLVLARTTDDAGKCFDPKAGGIKFTIDSDRAREVTVRIPLKANAPVSSGGECTFTEAQCEGGMAQCCYDYHRKTLSVSAGSREYEVSFKDFAQEGFGKAVKLDLADVVTIEFDFSNVDSFDIWIDDVETLPPEDEEPVGEPCADNNSGNIPFGSKPMSYVSGAIEPSDAYDDAVRSRYNQWVESYIASDCGGYVVDTWADTGAYTVSEAMGYGMILAAYMNDKDVFDGLWHVTRISTSHQVGEFMAWRLGVGCAPASSSDSQSATDGDMDIAYALLLADRQWGSGGGVDYRNEANDIIWALAERGLSDDLSFIRLGDWVHAGSGVLGKAMRPSDFMPDHFRAFQAITGDSRWSTALDNVYDVVADVQDEMGGLVPDFVVNADSNPSPAPGQILETPADGTYAVNACRVPWRLGVDYLVNGDSRAKSMLTDLTNRAKQLSGGNPEQFVGKYYGDGDSYSSDTKGALFYTGPLGVGAMASGDQGWLDALWSDVHDSPKTVYYQDALRLLSMIAMSGNWWSPHKVSCD